MSQISVQDGSIIYAAGTSDFEIEAAAKRAATHHRVMVFIWQMVTLVVLLGSWEISARNNWIDSFFYSYPSEIFARLWEFIN